MLETRLRRTLAVILLLMVMMSLAVFGYLRVSNGGELPPGVSPARARLIEALGPVRPVEGRLVGFKYAPVGPLPRGWRTKEVAAAIQGILREAEVDPGPRALSDRALADVLSGSLDRAIFNFNEASRRAPTDVHILSDLSAAYYARSFREGHAADAFLALVTAERAARLSSKSSEEALFNYALALDRSALVLQARSTWKTLLRLYRGSPWNEEYRKRLDRPGPLESSSDIEAALERAALAEDENRLRYLVNQHRQVARLYAERNVLADWAVHAGRHDPDAVRLLSIARRIGSGLSEVSGDHLLRDTVARIDAALLGSAPGLTAALIEGHRLYGEGLELGAEQASEQFAKAADLLEEADSPFRYRAMMRAAICAKGMLDHRGVMHWLVRLHKTPDLVRYPNLDGEVLWMLGVTRASLGEFHVALSYYGSAIPLFQGTGELENVAFLHYLMAESLRVQSNYNGAWEHLYKALSMSRNRVTSTELHNAMLEASEISLHQGASEVALLFQDEMVSNAMLAEDSVAQVESLLARSEALLRVGAGDRAVEDVTHATKLLTAIADPSMRARLEAELSAVSGEAQRSSNPLRSIASLGDAIEFFDQRIPARMPRLLLNRGQALYSIGQLDRAEGDLSLSLQRLEAERSAVLLDRIRASYFSQARDVLEELINLHVTEGDALAGFLYAERLRALWEINGPRKLSINSLNAIQEGVGDDAVLVEFAVAKGALYAWVVRHDLFELHKLAADCSGIRQRVLELQSALSRGASAAEVSDHLAWLYDDLVRPLASRLRGSRNLIFVLDSWLHRVPFAGLRDRESGRYLVEDWLVGVAPSASPYLMRPLRRAGPGLDFEGGVLVVGNPGFDRQSFPGLADLPGAEEEALRIAKLLKGDLLVSSAATKARFVQRAPAYRLIHWAGHAGVDSEIPLLSHLLFASDTGKLADAGILYAHEVHKLRLAETQLVVLAACRSGTGVGGNEGLPGLARSFISAGVTAVVTHLWPLEDREGEEFFESFYLELKSGLSPLEALNSAQLNALRNSDPRRRRSLSWSGFAVFGIL